MGLDTGDRIETARKISFSTQPISSPSGAGHKAHGVKNELDLPDDAKR
jgi:hypothetical protein